MSVQIFDTKVIVTGLDSELVFDTKDNSISGIDELQRFLVGSGIGRKSELKIIRHQFQTSLEIVPQETPKPR